MTVFKTTLTVILLTSAMGASPARAESPPGTDALHRKLAGLSLRTRALAAAKCPDARDLRREVVRLEVYSESLRRNLERRQGLCAAWRDEARALVARAEARGVTEDVIRDGEIGARVVSARERCLQMKTQIVEIEVEMRKVEKALVTPRQRLLSIEVAGCDAAHGGIGLRPWKRNDLVLPQLTDEEKHAPAMAPKRWDDAKRWLDEVDNAPAPVKEEAPHEQPAPPSKESAAAAP